MAEDIDFQIGHPADFEQFKVDIYFTNIGQVKIDPIWSILLTLDWSLLFYWVWVRHAMKNNSNPLCLIKNFNYPISRNQELVSLVNE